MKKIIAFIVTLAIILPIFTVNVLAVSTSAVSAIVIEAETGTVLYEKDADHGVNDQDNDGDIDDRIGRP